MKHLCSCDEAVGADGLSALITQDARDLKLVMEYLGPGNYVAQDLKRCKLAVDDLLTTIEVAGLCQLAPDDDADHARALSHLTENIRVRSCAKYATHQAQLLEDAVAPNRENAKDLQRSLKSAFRSGRATTEPPADLMAGDRRQRTASPVVASSGRIRSLQLKRTADAAYPSIPFTKIL